MQEHLSFYIGGTWVPAHAPRLQDVVNPASEQVIARVALGDEHDVDQAVAAARSAFATWGTSSREDRLALLHAIAALYEKRTDEIAAAISSEMGAPITFSRQVHVVAGMNHIKRAIDVLTSYDFDEVVNQARITREPVGVCGLITPWNWPMNQLTCKVAPALAAGCTVVLKPSELSPLSALIFAEIVHEAGAPAGVFNLVNGDGPGVGAAIAAHPDIDMVSFTGSTRAGILVAKSAADSVKRVTQELGGKSPNIILEDADMEPALQHAALSCFRNSGQSCNAPTRLIVPRAVHERAARVAAQVAESMIAGDPSDPETTLGPVANRNQFEKVQGLIDKGTREGAHLACGGVGRPAGLTSGFFVKPTVFSNVRNDMIVAREEIFGPVLVILPYDTEDEAVAIANDTPYGLAAYVTSGDPERARRVARRLRAGSVHINGARADHAAAFGGYKQSGNGREWGRFGFEEFLEVKSMFGYEPA